MKLNIKFKTFALGATLPLLLMVSGCGDKNTDATTTVSTTSTSNAPSSLGADVDNSRKNVRDRNDATLTPGDQGSSPADRDMTQKIRKELVSHTDYSTTAKNVKIITVNGKVTLRGPVKNDAEKSGIVALAKGIAGDGNVEDQLEVKAN